MGDDDENSNGPEGADGADIPPLEVAWVTNARQAIAEATADLRSQVADLTATVARLVASSPAPKTEADPPQPPEADPPQPPEADPPRADEGAHARTRLTRRREWRPRPRV